MPESSTIAPNASDLNAGLTAAIEAGRYAEADALIARGARLNIEAGKISRYTVGELIHQMTVLATSAILGRHEHLRDEIFRIFPHTEKDVVDRAIQSNDIKTLEALFKAGLKPSLHTSLISTWPEETRTSIIETMLSYGAKANESRSSALLHVTGKDFASLVYNQADPIEAIEVALEERLIRTANRILREWILLYSFDRIKAEQLLKVKSLAENHGERLPLVDLWLKKVEIRDMIDPNDCAAHVMKNHSKAPVEFLNQAMVSAASRKSVPEMRAYLRLGAEIDAGAGEALTFAARQSDVEMVELLLHLKADPNINDGAPLLAGIRSGSVWTVTRLLQGGATIEATGGKAFRTAVLMNHTALFRALLSTGVTPDMDTASSSAMSSSFEKPTSLKALAEQIGNPVMIDLLREASTPTPSEPTPVKPAEESSTKPARRRPR